MGVEPDPEWRLAVASALEWWHDAGVDMLVEDAPRDWLAAPAALAAPVVAAPAVDALPDTIEALIAWRAGPEAPEAAWNGRALPPSGPANARIMILCDCPDRDDAEAGHLLSGAAGQLFDRMLAAIGLARDAVHITAVMGRRPPPGPMAAATGERLHAIARRHVALVAPARLLLLGDAAGRAVLGTNIVAARGGLRVVKHEGGETGVVASLHPRMLLDRPAAKSESWKDLRMLIEGERS